jgi:hypothetical protein
MRDSTLPPALLEISADGQLVVPVEQLRQAGFVPGDRLVLSKTSPGQLYLHKVDILPGAEDLRETVGRLIRETFQASGYTTREAVVALGRAVRREIASER